MQADIAIVIVAFNRPYALQHLLSSILSANYDGYKSIKLIISIDFSTSNQCHEIAENCVWPFGEKSVILHKENLGLKRHVLTCGNYCRDYDAVIVLEDDLFVSSAFYDFAQQAYQFYKGYKDVSCIALYNYKFNEFAMCPFEPVTDEYDNYFLQVPCSWGQMWLKEHWEDFTKYSSMIEGGHADLVFLPRSALLWPSSSSWKRGYFEYLVTQGKYVVYPRISLTTNFGFTGHHYPKDVNIWQTPLLSHKKNFSFCTLNHSRTIYDAFFELTERSYKKVVSNDHDISFDLNGSKQLSLIKTKYLISSKKCKRPIQKYPAALYPYENNILLQLDVTTDSTTYFSLGETINFDEELQFDRRVVDIQRIFFGDWLLTSTGREQIYRSAEYKLGNVLLRPVRLIKKLFFKSTRQKKPGFI